MNIFEALREDHAKQRQLADAMVETHGDVASRKEMFEALKTELKAHAVAEERHFYAPLVQNDMTQELARHGVAEHHEMDELIEKLEETEMSSPGWIAAARALQEKVHHHLNDEEHGFFQMAGKVFSENEKETLAKDFQREKDGCLADL